MIVIGEKINGTRKRVAEAIKKRDRDFIKDLALRQVEAGAGYLDVNAGTLPQDEPEDMVWLINTVQEATDVTLCLDSANPKALAAGIEAVNRNPMINSLSGEKNRLEGVLPLACEHKTELIVLALDDKGIPKTVEERLVIIRTLVGMTRQGGLPDENLYIDPLITTIATGTESGNMAFEAMRRIKEEFPEAHLTAGLSNISYGLPARSIVNQAFAVLAIAAGLDSAIINPEDASLRSMLYAAELVLGRDKRCQNFTSAYRAGLVGQPKA
jgi:cobalamin-dependent methionine synthase I